MEIKEMLTKYNRCIVLGNDVSIRNDIIAIANEYKHVIFLYPNNKIANDIKEIYRNELSNTNFNAITYRTLAVNREKGPYNIVPHYMNGPSTIFILFSAQYACSLNACDMMQRMIMSFDKCMFLGTSNNPYRSDGTNPIQLLFNGKVIDRNENI